MPSADQLHPLFLHFPIALYGSGLFFDIISLRWHQHDFQKAGWWNLILGHVSAFFTILSGFIADDMMGHMELPFSPLKTHGFIALTAVLLLILLTIPRWRHSGKLPPQLKSKSLWIGGQAVAVFILYYGAHLGAKLANRI